MSKEGQFEIFYKDNYACLTVFPPSDNREIVYPEDVIGRLKILNIRGYRKQLIFDVIDEASGEPVPLVQWPEGRTLGPRLSLDTDKAGMTATVSIEPERQGGEPLSAGLIRRFLNDNKIISGIDAEILETIVLKKIFRQPVKVAFGTPAVNEKAAEPEYFFLVDRGKPFRELEYQRIDLKELNFIQNRHKGDLLAKLNEPQPPVDGTDIYGKILTALRGASPPMFSAGEGAVLSEDGKSIFAAEDGNARLHNGCVIVEPIITVENVDYSNGNIDFEGSVDISGRIADGFTVKTRGDIQIGKSVSKVSISCGGDIILKAGISGNDEGIIVCERDLYARYIESAVIICKGNVFVEEAIMHSSVKAGGDVILTGKRAEIFGGRIFAAGTIKCKKLGSINEPVTDLFLGTDLDSFTAMEELQKTVSRHSARVDELDTQIRQIKHALQGHDNPEIVPEKLSAALEQLQHESATQNEKLSSTLKELHELKRNIVLNESSMLDAEQQIYGKVHVYFNHLRWDSPGKGTGKTRLIVKNGNLLEK